MIKDYNKILYNILKPLVEDPNPVKLYFNTVDTDYDSQVENFVIYSTGVSDTPRVYGDGKVLLRRCNCDITVNEVGTGNSDSSGELTKRVEELLQKQNIHYNKIFLGYIESIDSIQTTFDFYLI